MFKKGRAKSIGAEFQISGGSCSAAPGGLGEESVRGEGQQSEAGIRRVKFRASL